MTDWTEKQGHRFSLLAGQSVQAWHGVEMALREAGPDGQPQFSDPSISLLQFSSLDVVLNSNKRLSIVTYQNDDNWGLCMQWPAREPEGGEPQGIYRARNISELPIGPINSVSVDLDARRDIERVVLAMNEAIVELVAGEVYEQNDGSLFVQLGGDESVIVRVSAQPSLPADVPASAASPLRQGRG